MVIIRLRHRPGPKLKENAFKAAMVLDDEIYIGVQHIANAVEKKTGISRYGQAMSFLGTITAISGTNFVQQNPDWKLSLFYAGTAVLGAVGVGMSFTLIKKTEGLMGSEKTMDEEQTMRLPVLALGATMVALSNLELGPNVSFALNKLGYSADALNAWFSGVFSNLIGIGIGLYLLGKENGMLKKVLEKASERLAQPAPVKTDQ